MYRPGAVISGGEGERYPEQRVGEVEPAPGGHHAHQQRDGNHRAEGARRAVSMPRFRPPAHRHAAKRIGMEGLYVGKDGGKRRVEAKKRCKRRKHGDEALPVALLLCGFLLGGWPATNWCITATN